MKKTILQILALLLAIETGTAMAELKNVTINLNATGEADSIQKYSMIYSYNSDMSNPINACETNDVDITSLRCENVDITSSKVYFQIVAILDDNTSVLSNIQQATIPLSLSTVKSLRIVTADVSNGDAILDDFSTDTMDSYRPVAINNGEIYIENGAIHAKVWTLAKMYHTTSLGSPDQSVEATVRYNGLQQGGGIMARIDPVAKTGYYICFENGAVQLSSFSPTGGQWLAKYDGDYQEGFYRIKLKMQGNTINVFVNNVLVIEKTDSTYANGHYAGFYMRRGGEDVIDITIDNFSAEKL